MRLRRLCKSAGSMDENDCPAIYVGEDPAVMVSQGAALDPDTRAQLLNVGSDEDAIAIPTETILRAAGMFLAEQGTPGVLTEVEAHLARSATPARHDVERKELR